MDDNPYRPPAEVSRSDPFVGRSDDELKRRLHRLRFMMFAGTVAGLLLMFGAWLFGLMQRRKAVTPNDAFLIYAVEIVAAALVLMLGTTVVYGLVQYRRTMRVLLDRRRRQMEDTVAAAKIGRAAAKITPADER
jgi:hypothetical protein